MVVTHSCPLFPVVWGGVGLDVVAIVVVLVTGSSSRGFTVGSSYYKILAVVRSGSTEW